MGQILSCIFRLIRKCLCCQDQKVSDYMNKLSSIPISTPDLLESLTHTNSSFKLHHNVIDICIDVVQESSKDFTSAHVLGVDYLEETKNGGSDDTNKHSSRATSTSEFLKSLIDRNVTTTCIDIVQESCQDSASSSLSASADVLGVNDLEESKNGGSDATNKHSSLPISTAEFLEFLTDRNVIATCINIVQENCQDSASAHVLGVNNLEESTNGGSDATNKHSSQSISTAELLESLTDRNVTATCIYIMQESCQDSASAHVLDVNDLEESKNRGSDAMNKHNSLPISTAEFLESLIDRNKTTTCIDIVQESCQDSTSAHVLGVNDLEESKKRGSDATNKHGSQPISTAGFLKSLTDRNVTTTCIDIVQESCQDSASSSVFASAHVLDVNDLEESKNGGSDATNKHNSLSISTAEFLESLTDRNVTATCFDIVQESCQDSASSLSASAQVLGVNDLEESKNRGFDATNKHNSLPISTPEFLKSLANRNVAATCIDIVQESCQDSASSSLSASAHVLGVNDLEESKNEGSDATNKHNSLPISTPELLESLTDTNSNFKLYQNVIVTCIDIMQESSLDSSAFAHVFGVDNLQETKNGGSVNTNKHSSLPFSTLSLESLTGTNYGFKLYQNVTANFIDIVEKSSQDPASASAHVLGVNNLEETRNGGPEKWFRHYCSSHKMLLVGEGDFSFSASLAVAFGFAKNMAATSLDSKKFLSQNYKKAISNIHELGYRGCTVLHRVDATKMAYHGSLGGIKFDRVIYNFPLAGFFPDEPSESERCHHQSLVSSYFENAERMTHENGEIHVRHKCNGFFLSWGLKGLATAVGLRLIEEMPFNFTDYPGYRTKYGLGGDKNFDSNPSKTYKFGLVRRPSSQQYVPQRSKGKRIK